MGDEGGAEGGDDGAIDFEGGGDAGGGGATAATSDATSDTDAEDTGAPEGGQRVCQGATVETHCYFVLPMVTMTWAEASIACLAEGAHLVTIASDGENWLVWQLTAGVDRWIGLFKRSTEPFQWVGGEPVVYTNWALGQPNNAPDTRARVMADSGTWTDLSKDDHHGAMCERDR
ncbi:MAG TPA: C-type lectin domain-containing protein [Polyangiaceae bacterium]